MPTDARNDAHEHDHDENPTGDHGVQDTAPSADAGDKKSDRNPNEAPEQTNSIVSVRAAVREYEMVYDELRVTNARARGLRLRANVLRKSLQEFMCDRQLERLGTRDGRLTVKLAQETTRVRPSKRDTMQCVIDTLGEDNSELAAQLLHKLYEDKKEVRTVTRLMKHTP